MDKIYSARIDESIIYLIDRISRQLNISKKSVVEDAIKDFAIKIKNETNNFNVYKETSGVWKRVESAESIKKNIRGKFEKSLKRYQ